MPLRTPSRGKRGPCPLCPLSLAVHASPRPATPSAPPARYLARRLQPLEIRPFFERRSLEVRLYYGGEPYFPHASDPIRTDRPLAIVVSTHSTLYHNPHMRLRVRPLHTTTAARELSLTPVPWDSTLFGSDRGDPYDKRFAGTVVLDRAGAFELRATAHPTDDKWHAFLATKSIRVPVMTPIVTLTGAFARHDLDLDDDGLINAIAVAPEVDVARAGTYRIEAFLRRADETFFCTTAATSDVALPAGRSRPRLTFAWNALRKDKVDDDSLSLRVIVSDTSAQPHTLDDRTLSVAFPVQADRLDQAEVEWLGSKGVTPVDDDQDGRFDALDFTFEVNVPYGGRFSIHGVFGQALKGATGHVEERTLSAGRQSVTFRFSGAEVRTYPSGPYEISGIAMSRKQSGDPWDLQAEPVPVESLDVSKFEDYSEGWKPDQNH